jgi:hypothetical protein
MAKTKKKRYTAADAAMDTVEIVVVTPVTWLLSKTVGRVFDVL